MKRIHFNFITVFLISAAMMIQSCENNGGEISSEDTAIIQDDALSAELFEDIFNETDLILEDQFNALKGEKKDTCKTVNMEKLDSDRRRITINYDRGNCKDFHERVKRGKIIITTSGKYRNEGFTRTVTFENYYVNDFKVEGTKTIINQGLNDNENVIYYVKLKNGNITTPEGKVITKEYEKTREWVKGYETPLYKWDNEYRITGKATGTNRNGISYIRTINEPLYLSATCRFILSGTVEIKQDDKPSVLIDYGNGECEDQATATVNDKTSEIRLNR